MANVHSPIIHMNVASHGAEELAEVLTIDAAGLRIGDEMVAAIQMLHPSFAPVPTIIVDSPTMDALHPPAIDQWGAWAVGEICKWARRSLPGERYQEHEAWLRDRLPALMRGEAGVSVGEVAQRTGLDEAELQKKIQRLRGRSTVAIGCCFQVKNAAPVLSDVLKSEDLAQLPNIAIALDHERISRTSSRLGRVRRKQRTPWTEKMCLMKLAIPIWLHEQSHAVRGADDGEFEEVSAQLDAYRVCHEGTSMVFEQLTLGGPPTIPSCAQMMRRLAKEQPPLYGAIFKGLPSG